MGHVRSGALHAFSVVGLAEICLLLSKHGAPHDAPLGTYKEIPSGPICYINSSNITRPSNMQLAYIGQNLVLGRMMSVLAASFPLEPWHFSAEVLTAVASASSVGGKVGPCSGTFICSLEWPCAASLQPSSRGARSTCSPRADYLQFSQNLQTSQHASLRITVKYMIHCESLPTHPSSWGNCCDLF